ncbi:MAG: hypothetical protein L6365_00540 [Desulfobulbaceae bacterium]|nr:hypothetical protein [Desulfobulbaceae bacterium]
MRVQSSKIVESICHKQNSGKSPSAASFAEVLEDANTFRNPVTIPEREILPLGVISDEKPTVSDILINNSQYRKDTWKIIFSDKNAQKDYARMQPGTRVFIAKDTQELLWEEGATPADSRPTQYAGQSSTPRGEQAAGSVSAASGPLSAVLPADTGGEAVRAGGEKISLGRLEGESATVSHLLLQNPRFSREAWRIIQADSNRDKAFTQIQDGEEIFIDPQALELSWQQSSPLQVAAPLEEFDEYGVAAELTVPADEELPVAEEDQSDPFSSNLVRAVQSYLGKSYREINCYGLVVRGLSQMGIKYGGRGGLQDQLVQMAKSRGLPANAYMTGEGLIEVSGEKVFTASLNTVKNVEKAAGKIFNEITPYLQKGYILSFSTPTRGHTGIISQHDQMWTFINSGYMDNRIEKTGRSKGVGEEVLAKEIKNWCKVAAKSGESLVITLGRLQEEKLRTAQRQDLPTWQKVL